MTRRALLATMLGGATVHAQQKPTGFHVTGPLTSTDSERFYGYFSIGKEIMVLVRPRSEPHRLLSAMENVTVQLSIFTPP